MTNFPCYRVLLSTVLSKTPRPSRVIGLSSRVLVEDSGILPSNTLLPGVFVSLLSVGYFSRSLSIDTSETDSCCCVVVCN